MKNNIFNKAILKFEFIYLKIFEISLFLYGYFG